MSFRHRVRTIYGKELIDLLRDRRTLIAMLIVPIGLYPLLMLGSLQAISVQTQTLGRRAIVVGGIGGPDGAQAQMLTFIRDEYERLRAAQDQTKPATQPAEPQQDPPSRGDAARDPARSGEAGQPVDGDTSKIDEGALPPLDLTWMPCEDRDRIEALIRERGIHVGILFEGPISADPALPTRVQLWYDQEEARSATGYARLTDMFAAVEERWNAQRRRQLGVPDTFFQPFAIAGKNLASPSSVLGQILPLILVLMTITGAIYPAIDITAGERERGTLETLLVCPVPVLDLIVGKFLVVTTIAILGATLNLASVCATVYFGGFNELITTTGTGVPYGQLALILLCLVPFAVLMSAIMMAVCSYARTFKEAQNYVTPIILAVLIPGGVAALPATELTGVMLVMPVGNMVLLTRELLVGAMVRTGDLVTVLLSTTLYATAAVAAAAKVFGKESVVFADVQSLRGTFDRRLIRPSGKPSLTMALVVTALLFPGWFFLQSYLQTSRPDGADLMVLRKTFAFMPVLFVVLPALVLTYWKVDVRRTFSLSPPAMSGVLGAVLIGATSWIFAVEIGMLQDAVFGMSDIAKDSAEALEKALVSLSEPEMLLLMAVIPALSEELLFRGFLLTALRGPAGRTVSILTSAVVFAVFHFILAKLPVTFLLGALLAWVCWQTRSIWPGIIVHFLHNGIITMSTLRPSWVAWLPMEMDGQPRHLPWSVLLPGAAVFVAGCLLVQRAARRGEPPGASAPG
ncbi:MAG: CPBP family intramembrane metalloprotease [Phycisphaerales bacterium]|nr:CPBP family intramembrane metalloprotease [Phycisphaerales bacterium]